MEWSAWKSITEEPHWVKDGCQGGGVYQFRATDGNGKPLTIPRACQEDFNGIMYIGEGNLGGRLDLVLKWNKRHSVPFNFDYYDLNRICQRNHLQYRWAACDDHKTAEEQLIDEYKKRTGDLPPCNVRT